MFSGKIKVTEENLAGSLISNYRERDFSFFFTFHSGTSFCVITKNEFSILLIN
jgi:hypothetical protein